MTTILITGISGFFGHHLLEHVLKNTDWNVVGLDGINYAGCLGRLYDIEVYKTNEHRIKLVWHDIRSQFNKLVSDQIGQVDYIVHTAAETHVDRSLQDSLPFVMTNTLGTCNLLEWVKHYQSNLTKYLQFSTDEVFGAAPFGTNYKEWDCHHPSNPYAASKAGADDLAIAFAHSFKLPIMVSHTMNMFGERQYQEKFIPMTIRKVILGEKIIIHGKEGLVSTRKWIHCRDASDGVLFILKNGISEDKYNIVGEECDVLSIAKYIAEVISKPLNYEFLDFHSTRPGHDLRYSLDGTKLKQMGWLAPKGFKSSLKNMIEWTMENPQWIGL